MTSSPIDSTLSRRGFIQKSLVTAGAISGAGALLSACGGASANVTLKMIMHNNPPTVQAIKTMNEAFHKKYPNITVTVEAPDANDYPSVQQTRLTAKNVDIVEFFAFTPQPASWAAAAAKPAWQQYLDSGLIMDLTGQDFLKYYDPQAIKDACTYNGKVYSTPTGRVAYNVMFYSKAAFAKYSLQVPKTWNDFVAVCQALQSNGVAPITMGGKDGWPPGLPTSGGVLPSLYPDLLALDQGLWTGSIKFTDPQMVQALQRSQTIFNYTEKGFSGIAYNTITSRFAAGKAAMLPDGTWDGPAIQQADPNFQFGLFPVPGSDNAADNNYLFGKYDISWSVASSSKNKDAATKWLAFFAEPSNYANYIKTNGFIPVQPNTPITPYVQELAGYPFRLNSDQILHSPQNAGKYAGFAVTNLAPLGDVSSPDQLAQLEQKDWDAAVKK